MNRNSRIYVTGRTTLIGSALIEHLRSHEYNGLIDICDQEPDLSNPAEVEDFFAEMQPEYIFHAAGLSGGIGFNQAHPVELMTSNLLSTLNVLQAAHANRVRKLLYLASSCCYPREAPQPLSVDSLMTGKLEATNLAYATAKLAGWQLCQAYRHQYGCQFITGIPANAFGPGDDFVEDSGHVIPALIRRTHEAALNKKQRLTVWGTGKPRREFVYSRDLAEACVFVMQRYEGTQPINLGGGPTRSIQETATTIARIVGFRGEIVPDLSKPDGMPEKCLDCRPLQELGWQPAAPFETALSETYHWFLQHQAAGDSQQCRANGQTLTTGC